MLAKIVDQRLEKFEDGTVDVEYSYCMKNGNSPFIAVLLLQRGNKWSYSSMQCKSCDAD